jgi:mannose-6-phosphate isomerase-like protein (cupin superfamily)
MRILLIVFVFLALVLGLSSYKTLLFSSDEGYVFESDAEVGKEGPSPHNGKGSSVGYVFFDKAPGYKLSFRKRVLHRGATIGYHKQEEDEVYYVISGTGVMNINGKDLMVKPGDAILTRTGSSHGLTQTGKDNLTIIITYEK